MLLHKYDYMFLTWNDEILHLHLKAYSPNTETYS